MFWGLIRLTLGAICLLFLSWLALIAAVVVVSIFNL